MDDATKKNVITLLESEPHYVSDDCWYTCPAATEARDGGITCQDSIDNLCNCGRDTRIAGVKRLLDFS